MVDMRTSKPVLDLAAGGGADYLSDKSQLDGTLLLVEGSDPDTPAAGHTALASADQGGITIRGEDGARIDLRSTTSLGILDFVDSDDFGFYFQGSLILRAQTTGQMLLYPGNIYPDAPNTGKLGAPEDDGRHFSRVHAEQGRFGGTNGAFTDVYTVVTTVSGSGATLTTSGLSPDNAFLLGVTARVTTADGGGGSATGMDVGDGADADRFGAAIALAAGTTVDLEDQTADPTGFITGGGFEITLTAVGGVGGTFDSIGVRVIAHYIKLTAPNS